MATVLTVLAAADTNLLIVLFAIAAVLVAVRYIRKAIRYAILALVLAGVMGGVSGGLPDVGLPKVNLPDLGLGSSSARASDITGTVTSVADGDTITIRTATGKRVRVRALGWDTPEVRRPNTPKLCGGAEASAAMHRLADGKRATVRTDPASGDTVDRFGRTIAYITVGGVDLGERQLRAGLARVYQFDGRRFSRLARYRRAQASAKAHRRGNWGPPCNGDISKPAGG